MSALALPASETVFWLLVLIVAIVVVFGAVAVLVMLLSMLRSISLSMAQLREVVEVQTARTPAEQQSAAQSESVEPGAVRTDPGPATEDKTQPDRAVDGGDARDGEPGPRPPESE